MSEQGVDLGAIRGDWDFHARYVTNAMEQTLKRLQKTWRALKAKSPVDGQVEMDTELMEEFVEACRQTRALTDDILLLKDAKPVKRDVASVRRRGSKKARGKK
jgi:hypothetical protein